MLWAMERVGKSPVERGQEIYYMRCWICHNEYTIAAEASSYAAPSLRDLFKRERLRSGRPVTDETVTAQIRSGGPQMPAYSPANLSDKDVADVIAYLKEKCGTFARGSGCFDEHNPPPNPRYRAQ
jgi:mono/diheme cytochrome c family protein